MPMIELRAFTDADIKAHNSGEDDETVRWLAGRAETVDSTRPHFAMLADNASRGAVSGDSPYGWTDQLAPFMVRTCR